MKSFASTFLFKQPMFWRLSTHRPRDLALMLTLTLGTLLAWPAKAAFSVDTTSGTVTDTTTGLVWDQCPYGLTGSGCATGWMFKGTWSEALTKAVQANTANYKGFNDWRLPNIRELVSLVNTGVYQPAIDSFAFPKTPKTFGSYFWSSTSDPTTQRHAMVLDSYDGTTGSYATKDAPFNYVRLVRGGQSFDALTPAFVLSNVSTSNTSSTATTLTGTLNASGTGYWLVVPQGATAPTPEQVRAGVPYPGVTSVIVGNGAMTANMPASFAINGLLPATTYTVYLVGEDAGPTLSNQEGPINFTTLQQPSNTSVASSMNSAPLGSSVTFTATITGYQPGTGTGTVAFQDAGANIAGCAAQALVVVNATTATATCTTSTLALGNHTVTAVYSGDTANLTSTSQPIDQSIVAAPPVLSGVNLSNTSSTATTLTGTLNASGTGYWLVVPQGATAPTAAQVRAGVPYPGATTVITGNGAMTANAPASFAINGLSPATAYTVYLVGEDAVPMLSNLGGPLTIITQQTNPAIDPPAGASAIPTLSQWVMLVLTAALGLMGMGGLWGRKAKR